jgi:hypothetical protein
MSGEAKELLTTPRCARPTWASTFITPIDREQIHGLINAMDDILDLLQDSAEVMSLYDVQPDRRGCRAAHRDLGALLRARAACGDPAAD